MSSASSCRATGSTARGAQNDEGDFDLVGTSSEVIAQMRAFIDLGVDYFMLDCGGFPALGTLERLVNEVLPALNR